MSETSDVSNLPVMHSLLGFAISMLLVFRTSTAYDRWWEGRKLWGQLVNVSRNLAVEVAVMVPHEQPSTREFFGRLIGMFPEELRRHLQLEKTRLELDDKPHPEIPDLDRSKHVPSEVVSLMQQRIQRMYHEKAIPGDQLIVLNTELVQFLDICGACERIKNTPIPTPTATEFEIAARVADSFAVKIKRPDKEDTIRIEPLADAPQRQAPADKPARKPRHDAWRDKDDGGHSAPRRDEPRDDAAAKRRGKPDREARAFSNEGAGRSREDYAPKQESRAAFRFDRDGKGAKPKSGDEPRFGKKKQHRNKSGQAGHWPDVSPAKPKFGKKPKKKHRG